MPDAYFTSLAANPTAAPNPPGPPDADAQLNRSFDQMLGFLYTDAHNKSPTGAAYSGLTGNEFNFDAAGNKVAVFRVDANTSNPYLTPKSNPREGFEATNLQIYGIDPVPAGTRPTMGGFVVSFTNAIAPTTRGGMSPTQCRKPSRPTSWACTTLRCSQS